MARCLRAPKGEGRQDNNTVQVVRNTTLESVAGESFNFLLASFTDANPNATTADYHATIDWGDGTTSNLDATAFAANSRGGFDLAAAHNYAGADRYTVSITIEDEGGSVLVVTDSIYVRIV